mgnify:FL=1
MRAEEYHSHEGQRLLEPETGTADVKPETNYGTSPILEQQPETKSFIYTIAGVSYYLLLLSAAIIGVGLMITLLVVKNSANASTGIMEYIETNVKTSLISDIQVSSSTTTCASGYTALAIGQWGGTRNGCYCTGITETVRARKCSSGSVNCKSVSSESAKDLTNYEGNVFCVKYLQNSTDYVYTDTCSSGYMSCGPYLCVKDGLSCPLINVTYSSTAPTSLPENSTYITLNDGTGYLTLLSGYSSTPLLNLQVELDGAPCLSSTMHPVNATATYYPLLETTPTGCGTYGTDTKSYLLTSESTVDMYEENSIPVDTVLKLYSEYLSGSTAQLYARSRVEFKQNSYCNSLDVSMLESVTDAVSGMFSSVYYCSLVLGVLGLFAAFAVGSYKHRTKKSFLLDEAGRSLRWPMALIALGLLVVNVVLVVFAYSNVSKLQAQSTALQELSDAECFTDPMVNQGATDFLATPKNVAAIFEGTVASLIITAVCFPIILIASLMSFKRRGFKLEGGF